MRIRTIVFSYQRKEMLESLLKEFSNCKYQLDYTILDDGSDFSIDDPNFKRFPHGGKPFYWKQWNRALDLVKEDTHDLFLFISDDFSMIDFDRIVASHLKYGYDRSVPIPYVFNLINDGRTQCWNVTKMKKIDDEVNQVFFTDCVFFSNKITLSKLKYNIDPINPRRFIVDKFVSSGVGQQLTQRLNKFFVPIYMPTRSVCYHGDHPSVMHPEHRLKNPLISR